MVSQEVAMFPIVVPVYAALLGFIHVFLAMRVIRHRRKSRVPVGAGGNRVLERVIRAHGNFIEYVPLAIILMTFVEMQGAPAWRLHLLGVLLIAGRVIHAISISNENEKIRLRVVAMLLTFIVLVSSSALIFVHAITQAPR
jgi:uncharacterized membrane protein YecN with MAPEG domain